MREAMLEGVVSIPFKRVSVFKAPGGPCGLPRGSAKFPSPLSGSRFSKREYVEVTFRPAAYGFHPL